MQQVEHTGQPARWCALAAAGVRARALRQKLERQSLDRQRRDHIPRIELVVKSLGQPHRSAIPEVTGGF